MKSSSLKSSLIVVVCADSVQNLQDLFLRDDDNDDNSFVPAVTDSDVSSQEYYDNEGSISIDSFQTSTSSNVPIKIDLVDHTPKKKLQWEFYGLAIWLELEEFGSDLSMTIQDFSQTYHTEPIPKAHVNAIYNMNHLTIKEAKEKLHQVKSIPYLCSGGQWRNELTTRSSYLTMIRGFYCNIWGGGGSRKGMRFVLSGIKIVQCAQKVTIPYEAMTRPYLHY